MTLKEARRIAHENGFTLTKRDGEYRLAPATPTLTPEQREARAYYTDDLEDALVTMNKNVIIRERAERTWAADARMMNDLRTFAQAMKPEEREEFEKLLRAAPRRMR